MPHFLKINFHGDANLGLYGFSTDKYCLIGLGNKKIKTKLKDLLKVTVYTTGVMGIDLLGIFCTGNSKGIIVPHIIEDDELANIKRMRKKILVLDNKRTALGNLILMNDNGILISPLLRKEKSKIEGFFDLPCEITKIAGLSVIGNLGLATNQGCVLHPKVKAEEVKIIEKILGVKSNIGTVSFGSPYPGAGIIANKNGYAASDLCSGPELGRITETLGFLE